MRAQQHLRGLRGSPRNGESLMVCPLPFPSLVESPDFWFRVSAMGWVQVRPPLPTPSLTLPLSLPQRLPPKTQLCICLRLLDQEEIFFTLFCSVIQNRGERKRETGTDKGTWRRSPESRMGKPQACAPPPGLRMPTWLLFHSQMFQGLQAGNGEKEPRWLPAPPPQAPGANLRSWMVDRRTFFFILLPCLMHRLLVQSCPLTNSKKSSPQRS